MKSWRIIVVVSASIVSSVGHGPASAQDPWPLDTALRSDPEELLERSSVKCGDRVLTIDRKMIISKDLRTERSVTISLNGEALQSKNLEYVKEALLSDADQLSLRLLCNEYRDTVLIDIRYRFRAFSARRVSAPVDTCAVVQASVHSARDEGIHSERRVVGPSRVDVGDGREPVWLCF